YDWGPDARSAAGLAAGYRAPARRMEPQILYARRARCGVCPASLLAGRGRDPVTFLASRPPGAVSGPGTPMLLGIPYDATSSFRRGSRWGPSAIRLASDSIETYSPLLDRDLDQLPFVDAGDLEVQHLDPPAMVGAIERAIGPGLPF